MTNIFEHLNHQFIKKENLSTEVFDMTKTFIDSEVEQRGIEKIREEAYKEGRDIGRLEGEVWMLYTRLNYSVAEIAYETELSVEKVQEIINELKI